MPLIECPVCGKPIQTSVDAFQCSQCQGCYCAEHRLPETHQCLLKYFAGKPYSTYDLHHRPLVAKPTTQSPLLRRFRNNRRRKSETQWLARAGPHTTAEVSQRQHQLIAKAVNLSWYHDFSRSPFFSGSFQISLYPKAGFLSLTDTQYVTAYSELKQLSQFTYKLVSI